MAQYLEANRDLLAARKQKGHLLWRDFRKVLFVRETRKELTELRQDVNCGNVAAAAAKDVREDIVEGAYTKRPYPQYLSHLGHGYLCCYEGTKDQFRLTKLYYKKTEGGNRLANPQLDAWDFNLEIRCIPSLILALEELHSFIVEKLKKENKSLDMKKPPTEAAPFMDDDVKSLAPQLY